MAIFIVLWAYLLTTKLRSVIRHNLGHSTAAVTKWAQLQLSMHGRHDRLTLSVPLCLSNCRTIERHLLRYSSTVWHFAKCTVLVFMKKFDLKIVNFDKTKRVKINKMSQDLNLKS